MFGEVPKFYERSKMDVIKKPFRLFFLLNEAYKWPKIRFLGLEGKKIGHFYFLHLKRLGLSRIVDCSAIFHSFICKSRAKRIYMFARVIFVVLPFVKVEFPSKDVYVIFVLHTV